jgi:hypothetical protein
MGICDIKRINGIGNMRGGVYYRQNTSTEIELVTPCRDNVRSHPANSMELQPLQKIEGRMMKYLILIAVLLIGCSTQISTPEQPLSTVIISAKITPDNNPYHDLWIITDMDSIVRTYTNDTLDTIKIMPDSKIALLWYRDGKAENMVWNPITISVDTIRIYFDNGVKIE